MGAPADTTATGASRLQALARRSTVVREEAQERCEACGAPIAAEHRHLLDLESRELLCACRACAILFDREGAGGGHFRLIADRRVRVTDFALDDVAWAQLRLPVDIAFFFHHSAAERVSAFYPSPMGATESLLTLEAWTGLEAANPVLRTLQPDVEALLVDRARHGRPGFGHWIVPIDECYRLVGLIRTTWKGLTGGKVVWQEIGRFFDDLDRRSRTVTRDQFQKPGAVRKPSRGAGPPPDGLQRPPAFAAPSGGVRHPRSGSLTAPSDSETDPKEAT